jgi:ABC-2 type transport system permease protein
MKSRIGAIAHKEFLHIVRDWRTLGMSFALPLVLLLLFGYAITFDIRDIRLAIYDADRSEQSRELVQKFTSSGYFKLAGVANSDQELGRFLELGTAQIALSIPEDFSYKLSRNQPVDVAVLVDGSESNTANIASGYVQGIMGGLSMQYSMETFSRYGLSQPPKLPPIDLRPRFWYNAELRSQNYIIPGLIATIMMVMTALLTALCIVGEKERGTLEQLISTPVRPQEIIIGKLIPYFVIGFVDSLLVAGVAVFFMGVPFKGSIWLFLLGTAVFALAGLGIGIRISSISKNQVMAMQIAVMASMLPSFLLSGFMFAIKNMPEWVQVITYLIPARYFLVILRGIFLKDMEFALMWGQYAFLVALAVFMLGVTVKTFKKKIG